MQITAQRIWSGKNLRNVWEITSYLMGFDCKFGVSANVNTVRDIIEIACETLGDTFDIILRFCTWEAGDVSIYSPFNVIAVYQKQMKIFKRSHLLRQFFV